MEQDLTQILRAVSDKEPEFRAALFSVLYNDLRSIAQRQMSRESAGHTLQATALVHEVFLKLMQLDACRWESRRHFFASAAEVMRRVLIDHARTRQRQKRGGDHQRVGFESDDIHDALAIDSLTVADDLLELREALTEFEQLSPEKASLVKLRFFSGLTIKQAAELLEISESTAERHWAFARAWLHCRIHGSESNE